MIVQPSYERGDPGQVPLPCSVLTIGRHLPYRKQKPKVGHFDRLNACPYDIRLPTRTNGNGRPASLPAPPQTSAGLTLPQTSAGLTLELVPEEVAVPGRTVSAEREEEPEPAPAQRYPEENLTDCDLNLE